MKSFAFLLFLILSICLLTCISASSPFSSPPSSLPVESSSLPIFPEVSSDLQPIRRSEGAKISTDAVAAPESQEEISIAAYTRSLAQGTVFDTPTSDTPTSSDSGSSSATVTADVLSTGCDVNDGWCASGSQILPRNVSYITVAVCILLIAFLIRDDRRTVAMLFVWSGTLFIFWLTALYFVWIATVCVDFMIFHYLFQHEVEGNEGEMVEENIDSDEEDDEEGDEEGVEENEEGPIKQKTLGMAGEIHMDKFLDAHARKDEDGEDNLVKQFRSEEEEEEDAVEENPQGLGSENRENQEEQE